MKRRFSAILAAILAAATLSGCTSSADMMSGISPNPVDAVQLSDVSSTAVTDFAVRLFQSSIEDDNNTLISPLSVLVALSMTANGANGNTRSQMEGVLGMPIDELNGWIHTYMENLPSEDTYKLSLANSIWFTDKPTFTVNNDFLQTNADYYGADIYRAPFDDTTCREINSWVKDKTDGMVKDILNRIPDNAVMYLVNALAFDAQWQTIYRKNQIRSGSFTTEDGITREVEMMYADESRYLADDGAEGFIKYYDDGKYAFAALLPDEGTTVAQYAASLTGERLHELLANAKTTAVETAIPKFESEYSVEMSEILQKMGMVDAFDWTIADFTKLGSSTEGNIVISRVLHKTYINVDEKGTKAGAATVVEMVTESAMMMPEDVKRIYLDRPFVYMLIDCETMLPFFIGTVMDVNA